ncbi:GNAT family N-acetyltransferase [Solibacillus sp. NPDC093137]
MKAIDKLIGDIDLYDFDNSTENCELIYSFSYKSWNQGYGTEAITI